MLLTILAVGLTLAIYLAVGAEAFTPSVRNK